MSRPTGVFKKSNSYERVLTLNFYERIPKAVLAAIAVSYASRQTNEDFTKVQAEILNEWRCLHEAGIVPQKPIKQ